MKTIGIGSSWLGSSSALLQRPLEGSIYATNLCGRGAGILVRDIPVASHRGCLPPHGLPGVRDLEIPTNSHLFQPRLTKFREFSGRPTRGNSRIEGTRPVRSGLPPPPSRLPNLDREETGAGFPYSFRGFAGVGAPRDARETRGTCAWRHIFGPGLVSRFPGGAFAPTAS